jgi:hypothetical protein
MTVEDFRHLGEMAQLKILIQQGLLVGEIKEKNMRIFMYQVQDFYVETRYTLETDELISIDPVSKMERGKGSWWTILNLTGQTKERHVD